jgi:hypothetical protein
VIAYIGLFQVKTVNLTEIATTFPGRAEIESNYRRLQRFFQHVEFNSALIAQLVVSFLLRIDPLGDEAIILHKLA